MRDSNAFTDAGVVVVRHVGAGERRTVDGNFVDGAVKIVSDAEFGEILGVHIVGANATELIGEAGLAMQLECTANELAKSIRVHPTFSEAVVDAARDAMNWALYLPRRR